MYFPKCRFRTVVPVFFDDILLCFRCLFIAFLCTDLHFTFRRYVGKIATTRIKLVQARMAAMLQRKDVRHLFSPAKLRPAPATTELIRRQEPRARASLVPEVWLGTRKYYHCLLPFSSLLSCILLISMVKVPAL